jgi:hypothetical protein
MVVWRDVVMGTLGKEVVDMTLRLERTCVAHIPATAATTSSKRFMMVRTTLLPP